MFDIESSPLFSVVFNDATDKTCRPPFFGFPKGQILNPTALKLSIYSKVFDVICEAIKSSDLSNNVEIAF